MIKYKDTILGKDVSVKFRVMGIVLKDMFNSPNTPCAVLKSWCDDDIELIVPLNSPFIKLEDEK